MSLFKKRDRVAAPVCVIFKDKKGSRSRCGYDIGEVIAIGHSKKTGKPGIKVRISTLNSVWAKRVTTEPFIEKWVPACDCDQI